MKGHLTSIAGVTLNTPHSPSHTMYGELECELPIKDKTQKLEFSTYLKYFFI